MTQQEREIQELMRQIEDSHEYGTFDSAAQDRGYDSDMFDPNEGVLGFDPDEGVLGFNGSGGRKTHGLSTYRVNLTYSPVAAVPAPVEVELWGADLNTGAIVGDSLVFTNAGGDFVTVTSTTSPFVPMQNSTRYEPFRIRFGRLILQDAGQFQNDIVFRTDSKYGSFSGNPITPDDFFTPDQFQGLRADVPMGFAAGPRNRMIFDVNPSEIAPGMNIVFYIDKSLDPTRRVTGKGKPALVNMSGEGLQQSMPSMTPGQAIAKLVNQNQKMLGAIARRPGVVRTIKGLTRGR